jgi:pimeloyl-ACP methyl ester carboxylesterase
MSRATTSGTAPRDGGGYAAVNGLEMYYETHGSGEPLVMLHGGLSTVDELHRIVPVLAERRRVIAVERQGHGRTADIGRPFRFAQGADDTAGLLRRLGVARADVFGYSVGGTVALELAVRHPALVRTLVLCSAVFSMDGYHPEVRDGLRQLTADALPPQMRDAYERVAPRPADWPTLVAKAAEQARSFVGLPADAIRGVRAPALVFVAQRDVVRLEHAADLARLLRAELVVLPDSDHASYLLDPPDGLLSKLTAFLDTPQPEAGRPPPQPA